MILEGDWNRWWVTQASFSVPKDVSYFTVNESLSLPLLQMVCQSSITVIMPGD